MEVGNLMHVPCTYTIGLRLHFITLRLDYAEECCFLLLKNVFLILTLLTEILLSSLPFPPTPLL